MATSYARVRMFWGLIDVSGAYAQTPQYTTAQLLPGGPNAQVGSGVGVRRCQLVIDRTTEQTNADPAVMHFDFLNITGGVPDDTWTTSDFTTLEAAISGWWTGVRPYVKTSNKLVEYRWYRVGTGITKPNPAVRVMNLGSGTPGTSATPGAPQTACSITFRTAVRKSWGRTYLPISPGAISSGRLTNTAVDAIAGATDLLVTTAAGADMHLVVLSKTLASSLNVERVECDDNTDVIRRRRWKQSNYKKLLP